MPAMTVKTWIEAPVELVFRQATDFPHAADHISGIERIEMLTAGPVGAGTRFRETRRMFNREATEEFTVTEFTPGQSYTLECHSCGCAYKSTFRFSPDAENTLVEMDFDYEPLTRFAKWMSLFSGLLLGPIRKCCEKDLADLKIAVEAEYPPAPDSPEEQRVDA